MASRKRKRTSDPDQSDRQTRARTRAISGERTSATGTDAVTQLKEKGARIAQKPATPATARKRGRPSKDPVERPTKKQKPTPRRAVASSSSTAPLSVPSPCAPSDSSPRRSKRNTRSSAQTTSAPRATSPQIEVTPHNSSSLRHYKYFSQVESTQASSAHVPPGSSSSSQSRGSSNFRLSGEVPDSESELDDGDETDNPSASFRPETQTTSRTASSQSDKSDYFAHKVRVPQSYQSLLVR
jgi:hypothetical protein